MQVRKILNPPYELEIDLFFLTDSSMKVVNFIGRGGITATQI